jgi:hypothetical protein
MWPPANLKKPSIIFRISLKHYSLALSLQRSNDAEDSPALSGGKAGNAWVSGMMLQNMVNIIIPRNLLSSSLPTKISASDLDI